MPGTFKLLQSGTQLLGLSLMHADARVHLNNQSPTWLQGLTKDIPEAKWFVKDVRNDPIQNARHAVMPGIGTFINLPQDNKQIAKVPHTSRRHNCPCSLSIQSKSPAQSCRLEVLGLHRRQLPGPGRQDSYWGRRVPTYE
eukprot:1142331-Pelagomonas_calceolata.AAC.1